MAKKKPRSKANRQVEAPQEPATNDSIDDTMISFNKAQTVLMKVCRLCESKDGPFLNIFDADTMIIKKIDDIMPFDITENDDLPHKICFRCSAKVEELFEFMNKCVKTQENLRTELGKKSAHTKTKTRVLWEKKLDQSNLSNDDICNALIKKAMEGIKGIPLNPLLAEEENSQLNKKGKAESPIKKDVALKSNKSKQANQSDDDNDDDQVSLKQVKLNIEKCDDKVVSTRSSRSSKTDSLLEGLPDITTKVKQYSRKSQNKVEETPVDKNTQDDSKNSKKQSVNIPVSVEKKVEEPNVEPKAPEAPAINIMDYVSVIKVNDVGTLYMCKLCSRNFLRKEIVYSHGCAKNNVPKDNIAQNTVAPPQIPKPSTVKYIKMDSNNFKKPIVAENKVAEKKLPAVNVNIPVQPEGKPKPKAGPASRINRNAQNQSPAAPPPKTAVTPDTNVPIVPAVSFPGIPSLNTRYKLVPGPNNGFTLIEDFHGQEQPQPATNVNTKKRSLPGSDTKTQRSSYQSILPTNQPQPDCNPVVFDIEDDESPPQSVEQPYPVGLFQTVPHHSGMFATPKPAAPPTFSTPAMKKQSYTVVQTGNPSKLLISAKPQHNVTEDEPSKKKPKKSKAEVSKEYNVSIDDTSSSKNPGFFTFINVDPLLQPSYVLPTDNIIQESQISTSTPAAKAVVDNKDNKYECNMCNETFSREKKLLAHIQSHYNQMDEEDQLRKDKTPSHNKRKARKT